VEGDVEMRIVHPDRPALVERHEGQALAVARDEVQPAGDLLDQFVVGGGVAVEDHAAGDVHVRGVALQVQEGAVEPGQAVRIGHGADSGTRTGCDDAHTNSFKVLRASPTSQNDLPNRLCPVRG
jgi:hypothetical protein